jgi:hypothetical protein
LFERGDLPGTREVIAIGAFLLESFENEIENTLEDTENTLSMYS